MGMTIAKTVVFSILPICARNRSDATPEVCHNQTDPLPNSGGLFLCIRSPVIFLRTILSAAT
jgi:hypothetical protein